MTVIPTLKRFDITVYRNKNGVVDTAQVPAASTIEFYAQGASIKTAVTNGTSPRTLQVWHAGTIKIGDRLWPRGQSAPELLVTGMSTADPANIQITVTFTGLLSVGQNDRLIRAVPSSPDTRPNAYSDPLGSVVIGTTLLTTEAGRGRASCYLREFRFDYTVTVAGESPRVFPDAEGSFVMR